MTPLGRAGGLALSVSAHVAAVALLLTLSVPEWTRPLFVDLVERAESIGGGMARPGAPAGQPAAGSEADAPAPHGLSGQARRMLSRIEEHRSKRDVSSATSSPEPTPPVQPAPTPALPPAARPIPQTEPVPAVPPLVPTPALPSVASPPVASPPPVAASASSPTSEPPAAKESSPADAPRTGTVGGDARGGDAQGRGEVRADAGSGGSQGAGGAPGSALGLGTGGGAIPPEYGPYLQRFRRHVQESVVYPLAARRQSLRGTVELDVSLDPSGRVRDVRVARSSSYGVLDDAAVDTLRRLEPLPLPESLPRRPLLIRLPLVFDLQ
jgi:periplasmic protein TonB